MAPAERIGCAAGRLECSGVPWDTAACGFGVGQIDSIRLDDPACGADLVRAFRDWCDHQRLGLVSCRIPHDRLVESHWLEQAGFRFIEMTLQPVIGLPTPSAGTEAGLLIEPGRVEDLGTVGRIAETAFTTDRFSMDPRLPRDVAGRRYRAWVESTAGHPSQRLVVFRDAGTPVGFFIEEERPDGTAYWHLTAVAPEMQGRGHGRRIWRAMLARAAAAGLRRVRTTIAARNLPVLNLYASLGFRFENPMMTFHWVRSGDEDPV